MSEPLIHLLSELPRVEPDPARAERIRMRCRARLAPRKPDAFVSRASAPRLTAAWQPLIAVLGVAYLTDVIVEAIRLYGGP
jgi:hypothetical protein